MGAYVCSAAPEGGMEVRGNASKDDIVAALRQSGAGVYSAAQFDKNSAGGGSENPVGI